MAQHGTFWDDGGSSHPPLYAAYSPVHQEPVLGVSLTCSFSTVRTQKCSMPPYMPLQLAQRSDSDEAICRSIEDPR